MVSNTFVSVKNGQIISKDAVKVLKGVMISSDKWNHAFLLLSYGLQKCFLLFCTNLINPTLHVVDFIATITQMGWDFDNFVLQIFHQKNRSV